MFVTILLYFHADSPRPVSQCCSLEVSVANRLRIVIPSSLIDFDHLVAFIPLWILPNTFSPLSAGAFCVQFGVQGAWGVVCLLFH